MPTVQYMSKERVQEHLTPAYVLRIRHPGLAYSDLPVEHPEVITVNVMTDSLIDPETCEEIISFCERAAAANTDIVVHCNEGKYRSRMVANFVWRFFADYSDELVDWKGGEMSDRNYKSLYNHYKATRGERKR